MSVHSAWETEPVGQRIPPRIIGLLSTQEDLFHPHPHIKAKHDHIHKPVALGMVEWRQADPQSTLVSPSHQPPVNTRAGERRCIHRWRGWWLRKTYVTRLYHTHTHTNQHAHNRQSHMHYTYIKMWEVLCALCCAVSCEVPAPVGSTVWGLHCSRAWQEAVCERALTIPQQLRTRAREGGTAVPNPLKGHIHWPGPLKWCHRDIDLWWTFVINHNTSILSSYFLVRTNFYVLQVLPTLHPRLAVVLGKSILT